MTTTTTRATIRNILFATDFSESSLAALPYVETIARRYEATVYLAHVLSPSAYAFVPAEAGIAAFDAARAAAEQALGDLASAPPLRALPHRKLLMEGDIAATLRDVVRDCGIDLLVLGTHGRTGLKWFIMGSIAEQIVKYAPCPVLIIGPRAPHEVSRSAHLRRIVYATDFTHESLGALDYALDLAQEHQAKLTLLTVLGAGDVTSAYRATLVASATARLREMLPEEAALWCDPELAVEFGDVASVLHDYSREHCDLLILGGRSTVVPAPPGAHKFGSVTHKVITDAPCAVLSVPERKHL